ncbi:hypothetical protein OV079_29570 [Nannocystis pusilla]|uniref:Uncharacterized protein n=1 Tax=Nannocystis pusilla TaxID=889268 RepID=A0A9X3IZK8_9BACT|nr:hypothetical protein [Nannocystis pusilla]MCY1009641.1 hypothetical protein [Nannocystis pusilla]
MTGAVRKTRNVHGLVRRWGAVTLEEDKPSGHGDLVDLVAFYKPEVRRRPRSSSTRRSASCGTPAPSCGRRRRPPWD